MDVPIYLMAGFLESGKTGMINELLGAEYFNEGERTIILCCEEGEQEYDPAGLVNGNAVVVSIDSAEELDQGVMNRLDEEYRPERVIIEYNSVWTLARLFSAPKPDHWKLAQLVAMADATTFDLYMNNMRNLMTDSLMKADLVVINRCTEQTPKSAYRRMIKGMNAGVQLIFDNTDGTSDDGVTEEDLPYDMSADIIRVTDEDFGTFYIDAMDHPDRYDGRTIRLKGMMFALKGLQPGQLVFGRYAMTCCADDIGGIGFVATTVDRPPAIESWVEITAVAKMGFSPIHNREALLLTVKKFKGASKPKEELVSFV